MSPKIQPGRLWLSLRLIWRREAKKGLGKNAVDASFPKGRSDWDISAVHSLMEFTAYTLSLIPEIPFASKTISRTKDSHKGHLSLNGFILWEEATRDQVKEVPPPFRNRRDTGNLDQLSRRRTDPWNDQVIPYWERREWREWGNFLQPDGEPDLESTPKEQPQVHLRTEIWY